MGEFGTGDDSAEWRLMLQVPGCWLPAVCLQILTTLLQFLAECDCDWSYWALDGYKYPGEDETFGILEGDYKTVRDWSFSTLTSIL